MVVVVSYSTRIFELKKERKREREEEPLLVCSFIDSPGDRRQLSARSRLTLIICRAIQDRKNISVWLEFPHKEWDQSNTDAHQSEPEVQAQMP